jgi:hypothetical protein
MIEHQMDMRVDQSGEYRAGGTQDRLARDRIRIRLGNDRLDPIAGDGYRHIVKRRRAGPVDNCVNQNPLPSIGEIARRCIHRLCSQPMPKAISLSLMVHYLNQVPTENVIFRVADDGVASFERSSRRR